MTEASTANWEMAIVLPLGVIANQLMRIEAQLRLLNMKALDFARAGDKGSVAGQIEARIEHINEAIDAIRLLVGDIETDMHPRLSARRDEAVKNATEAAVSGAPSGLILASMETAHSARPQAKALPERDD